MEGKRETGEKVADIQAQPGDDACNDAHRARQRDRWEYADPSCCMLAALICSAACCGGCTIVEGAHKSKAQKVFKGQMRDETKGKARVEEESADVNDIPQATRCSQDSPSHQVRLILRPTKILRARVGRLTRSLFIDHVVSIAMT